MSNNAANDNDSSDNLDALKRLPPLAQVIAAHELSTRKALGQHFLLDTGITDKIVRYAGDVKGMNVIEIGPGPGGLTRSLLTAGAKKLYVIEMDERCLPALEQIRAASGGRMDILHGDALAMDLLELVPAPRKIVANLPYNAGTQMLINWLHAIAENGPGAFASMTLMFQKEVAERIVAAPDTSEYGRLAVLAQWLCDCRYDFELPPGAFSPPPKVSSAVVTLTPRAKPLVDVPRDALEKVVAAAFGQRRKMLRSALKTLGVDTEKLLADAKIDGTLRAEVLDVTTLCNLAAVFAAL